VEHKASPVPEKLTMMADGENNLDYGICQIIFSHVAIGVLGYHDGNNGDFD
jgi:hypothetical protein